MGFDRLSVRGIEKATSEWDQTLRAKFTRCR